MTIIDPYFAKVFLLMNMNQQTYPVDQSNAKTYLQQSGANNASAVAINTSLRTMTLTAADSRLRLKFPASRILTGDFTIEINFKTGAGTGNQTLLEAVPSTNHFTLRQTSNRLDLFVTGTNTHAFFPAANTNYKLEVVRVGGLIRFFVDGIARGSDFASTDPIDLTDCVLMNNTISTEGWTPGNIAALRFTDGAARHTADFNGALTIPPYPLRYADLVGTIKDSTGANVPAGWRVTAIRRDTGDFAGTALTVTGGTYTLPCTTDQEVTIVCANAEGTLLDDLAIRVMPG